MFGTHSLVVNIVFNCDWNDSSLLSGKITERKRIDKYISHVENSEPIKNFIKDISMLKLNKVPKKNCSV